MNAQTMKLIQSGDTAKKRDKRGGRNFQSTDVATVPGLFNIQRKASCACGGGCRNCQAKSSNLSVSQPNDAAEIEADHIADKVMRMSDEKTEEVKTSHAPAESLQRKCSECEDDETVFRKESDSTGFFNDSVNYASLNSLLDSGGATSLSTESKAFFEPRFGRNFGDVRIHTGADAANSARALNAKAYTVGQNIVFGQGEYSPGSESGKKLLAHELTHTIQQKTGKIHRKPDEKPVKKKARSAPNPCTRRILSEGTCKELVENSKWVCCDPDNGIEYKKRSKSAVEGESNCPSKKWTPIFTCDSQCDKAREKGCRDDDNWMAVPPNSFKRANCGDIYTICANGKQTTGYMRDKSSTEKSYEVSPGIQKALGVTVGDTFYGSIYRPGANQATIDKDACCNGPQSADTEKSDD